MDAADLYELARARTLMVDGQIRPNKVSDPRILAALASLPRERFLPPALAGRAYLDGEVDLGGGRAMPAPLAIARLVQLAAPRARERALVVGAGTGYGAALLAACGTRVTALDDDPALLALARPVLAALAPSVAVVSGSLANGWPPGAPYDIVLIEGAVEAVPAALARQVRPDGGRLVAVRAAPHGVGEAVLGEVSLGGLALRAMFDCAMRRLPSLQPAAGFVF